MATKMRPVPLERSRLCAACTHACSRASSGCIGYSCDIHTIHNTEKAQDLGDWDRINNVSYWAKWAKSKQDFLRETSTSGCHLCIIIAHAFDEASVATFKNMPANESLQLCFAQRSVERDPSGKLDFGERAHMTINNIVVGDDLPTEFWLKIRPERNSAFDKLVIDLRLRPLQENDTSQFLKTLPGKHGSTINDQNLQLASKWIKSCLRSHPQCKAFQPQKPGWRPTRLVYIGLKSQQPKLVVSHGNSASAQYVALSYCWGSDNNAKLTQEKLCDFQKEISLASLSKTIQEAISTTRDLGYEYIWVDALCIIQDSKQDWIAESSKMGDIYGSAAVTLAAAGNSSVKDSMFSRRDPRTIRPCVADIQHREYRRISYPWAIYPNQPERLLANTINESPLSRRAWALQELLLSPRTLVFGQKQMAWSCVTTEASETFPLGLDPKFGTPLNEAASLSHLRQRLMRISDADEPPSEFWSDFIPRFTRASLTIGSDTLVALQGLVERIIKKLDNSHESTGTRPKIDYAAGLWRDRNFQRSLLWRPKLASPRRRPERYRAPSWSWASLDGEVESFEGFVTWVWNQKEVELAKIVEVYIKPRVSTSLSLTGQVTAGHMDMECHLRPCYLLKTLAANSPCDKEHSEALIISSQQYHELAGESLLGDYRAGNKPDQVHQFANSCTLDVPDEIAGSHWIQVYCVPLQLGYRQTDRYEQSVWETYEGLVLLPEPGSLPSDEQDSWDESPTSESLDDWVVLPTKIPTFRRIGTFTFDFHDENREARQDELLGPIVQDEDGVSGRKKELVRVI